MSAPKINEYAERYTSYSTSLALREAGGRARDFVVAALEREELRSRLAALAPLEAAARELVLSLEAVDVIGFFRALVDVVAAARALPEEGK